MGFSRQACLSGLPFPSLGDLPDPGIEAWSPTSQADSLPSEPPGKPNYGESSRISNRALNIGFKEVVYVLFLLFCRNAILSPVPMLGMWLL